MITELMMAKGHWCLHVNCQGRVTKSLSTGESAPGRHETQKGTLPGALGISSGQQTRALISPQLFLELPRIFSMMVGFT